MTKPEYGPQFNPSALVAEVQLAGMRGTAVPGGYKLGEKVFYTGASQTFPSGSKLVHGQQGEVTGPATLETHKGKAMAVLFPGNKGRIDCYLTSVRRRRATSAASTRACALHTRRCPQPVRSRDSLCRGTQPLHGQPLTV